MSMEWYISHLNDVLKINSLVLINIQHNGDRSDRMRFRTKNSNFLTLR